MTLLRVLIAPVIGVVLLFGISCGGSKSVVTPPVEIVRSVFSGVFGHEDPLVVPATITASYAVSPNREDNEIGPGFISKVEVNYGDGGGWQELDSFAISQYRGTHTYTEPGEYAVNARATYWDGDVIDATTWIVPVAAGTE